MWSHRHKIKKPRNPLAQATRKGARVNRHSSQHQDKVMDQVRRLMNEERAYRERWALDIDGEGEKTRPYRGVRHAEESDFALAVCNVYLHMGPTRSFSKVLERWQRAYERGLVAKVPTLNTLKSWSRRFEWQARAYLTDHVSHGDVLRFNLLTQEMQQRAREERKRRQEANRDSI